MVCENRSADQPDRVWANVLPSEMTDQGRQVGLFSIASHLHGHTYSPWQRPVAFAARLRFERGTEACCVLFTVRVEISVYRPAREAIRRRRTDFFDSFTFEAVSRLDQEVSTTLANIREWRNSFVRINRIPLDVLSLIPAHLASQKDRIRASFVCRHWRRTFLQRASLWSQLTLSKGEVYTKTLLERAKGSTLDIITCRHDSVGAVTLLPPHNQQIKHLEFAYSYWEDIQRFSEINSGPLPSLDALKIYVVNERMDRGQPDTMTPPTLPLFTSAVNLKNFSLCSERFPFLNHFIFPNLTSFELSAAPGTERFRALELLDFLEASPTLRTAHLKIIADLVLMGVPQERVVLLPNVETFSLAVSDSEPGFKIVTHISCPSAKETSLIHEKVADDMIPREIFPSPVSWSTIVHQYTRSPVESIALKIEVGGQLPEPLLTSSLVFQSHGGSVLQIIFRVASTDDDEELQMPFNELHEGVFLQAHRTIRDHPSLAKVKRLQIHHRLRFGPGEHQTIVNEVGRLFKLLGALDELILYGCDPHLYITPFFNHSNDNELEGQRAFPAVKEFRISHPLSSYNKEKCVMVVADLAKSQHALGIPFERVTVCMERLPKSAAETLRPWAGVVDCFDELCMEDF